MFFLGVSFTGLATRLEGGLATSFTASLAEISGSDPVVELRGRYRPSRCVPDEPSPKSDGDSTDSGDVRAE